MRNDIQSTPTRTRSHPHATNQNSWSGATAVWAPYAQAETSQIQCGRACMQTEAQVHYPINPPLGVQAVEEVLRLLAGT